MTGVNEDLSDESIRDIPGNAPIDVKRLIRRWLHLLTHGFGTRTIQCLELVEVSIINNPNEQTEQEARVVLETTVTEGMLNHSGKLHRGCIALFVDLCTTFPITAMSFAKGGHGSAGVSLNIDIIYHASANLGDRLRMINTSTTVEGLAQSARMEIWDVTHHRLVASATQVKMEVSPSKL